MTTAELDGNVPTPSAADAAPGELPLVVQLGFAGSRALVDPHGNPASDVKRFHAEVETWLAERIRQLHGELGLEPRHFFCGISQVAIGADTIFSHVCRSLGIPQRVFLPQHRDEYLRATSSDGTADFTAPQQEEARMLLDSPRVIQQHVASESPDRSTRFEEVNLEIAQDSDFVVCLARAEAKGKSGGTHDLIERAVARGRPVLEIRVAAAGGKPRFEERWHGRDQFRIPQLPATLAAVRLGHDFIAAETPIAEYCRPLKRFGSEQAKSRQTRFKTAALVIIGTHVLATLLAAMALAAHSAAAMLLHQRGGETVARLAEQCEAIIPWLLGIEIVLLSCGFIVHESLHHSAAGATWAMSRLVAELGRSVMSVDALHINLGYLFTLPFPDSLRPVLRTINVLHLKSTRNSTAAWEQIRDGYVASRLDGKHGQIEYYKDKLAPAKWWLAFFRRSFLVCSGTALLATALKLAAVLHLISLGGVSDEIAPRLLGILAIVLPTVAVGALSLAAALDLEAREHTYLELHKFLLEQKQRLERASKLSLPRLVLETESRLLAETANWFSRRSFTGVA